MIKGTETISRFVKDINPLIPETNKHQFSPNNINTQSRDKVVRINEKTPKRKCFDLLPNSLNVFNMKID